ncbi:MAG: hypothetical protein A3D92_21240 [Bacteroidetes bacterium RIFCSPHIGHO2_02_FULL_44_7]|nr:MAG: hypothetical protein A3D92_21240 [Bacteroidetes bacterium RIFCSPHIGHO2_02_FULL_44_7]
MLDSSIRAVIFDFGGVLINIDYAATIQAFRDLGVDDTDILYSQAQQSSLFDAIETGQISPQHFINRLLELMPAGTSPNQVVAAWNAMILDVPKSSITLLEQLREEGRSIYLLSNTNALHIDLAYRRWKKVSEHRPEALFNHVYLSHEMGMRKPDPAIFTRVCLEQQLDPGSTLFIDDSPQHVEGAQKAGLKTIHLLPHMSLQAIFS